MYSTLRSYAIGVTRLCGEDHTVVLLTSTNVSCKCLSCLMRLVCIRAREEPLKASKVQYFFFASASSLSLECAFEEDTLDLACRAGIIKHPAGNSMLELER